MGIEDWFAQAMRANVYAHYRPFTHIGVIFPLRMGGCGFAPQGPGGRARGPGGGGRGLGASRLGPVSFGPAPAAVFVVPGCAGGSWASGSSRLVGCRGSAAGAWAGAGRGLRMCIEIAALAARAWHA